MRRILYLSPGPTSPHKDQQKNRFYFLSRYFSGYLLAPIGESVIIGLMTYWWLFLLSSVPGSILGFLFLLILKRIGYTWEDFI